MEKEEEEEEGEDFHSHGNNESRRKNTRWKKTMRKLDRGERERYLLFLLWIVDTWLFVNGSRSTIVWGHSSGSGEDYVNAIAQEITEVGEETLQQLTEWALDDIF